MLTKLYCNVLCFRGKHSSYDAFVLLITLQEGQKLLSFEANVQSQMSKRLLAGMACTIHIMNFRNSHDKKNFVQNRSVSPFFQEHVECWRRTLRFENELTHRTLEFYSGLLLENKLLDHRFRFACPLIWKTFSVSNYDKSPWKCFLPVISRSEKLLIWIKFHATNLKTLRKWSRIYIILYVITHQYLSSLIDVFQDDSSMQTKLHWFQIENEFYLVYIVKYTSYDNNNITHNLPQILA